MTGKWSKFKSTRIVNGKLRKVVVGICGDIINRNPMKEELKGLKKESDVRITRNNKRKLSEEEQKEIGAIDLSGENCNSPYDGKCPRGYNYDAKTSALHIDYWT